MTAECSIQLLGRPVVESQRRKLQMQPAELDLKGVQHVPSCAKQSLSGVDEQVMMQLQVQQSCGLCLRHWQCSGNCPSSPIPEAAATICNCTSNTCNTEVHLQAQACVVVTLLTFMRKRECRNGFETSISKRHNVSSAPLCASHQQVMAKSDTNQLQP